MSLGFARASGAALAALLLATGAALEGCGYTTRRLTAISGVSTIAVAQFDNDTYWRDLEPRLTQAVAEEVRARTPWRIASPQSADVVLSGTIRAVAIQTLAENEDEVPILRRYRVTVDCRLVERGTGATLREWTTLARQEFAPVRFNETLDASTQDGVTRSLAERIVMGLERPIGAADTAPPSRKKLPLPFPR